MQRLDRPLSLREILDRAITIVATTLSITIPFATLRSFAPTIIIDELREIERHRAVLPGEARADA
jgi:hypothetical protein